MLEKLSDAYWVFAFMVTGGVIVYLNISRLRSKLELLMIIFSRRTFHKLSQEAKKKGAIDPEIFYSRYALIAFFIGVALLYVYSKNGTIGFLLWGILGLLGAAGAVLSYFTNDYRKGIPLLQSALQSAETVRRIFVFTVVFGPVAAFLFKGYVPLLNDGNAVINFMALPHLFMMPFVILYLLWITVKMMIDPRSKSR